MFRVNDSVLLKRSSRMLLAVFMCFFVLASGDLFEPHFQVLTPDELAIKTPRVGELVVLRIGVKRPNNELEDLEKGENYVTNDRIFFYDERLKLKEGDVINYLIAFKDNAGYHASTGKYVFDGVYQKKQSRRRRRSGPSSTTEESTTVNFDSRFGFHDFDYGHGWHSHHNNYHHHNFKPHFGFNGPYQHHPHFLPQDCNCEEKIPSRTTTTEFPDIDIRFSD